MTNQLQPWPMPKRYTDAWRSLLPSLLIAAMFMTVSIVSKSAADSRQSAFEENLIQRAATKDELRISVPLHSEDSKLSAAGSALTTVTTSGLGKLTNLDHDEANVLERVTIEIDVPVPGDKKASASQLPLELLEVLSRRATPLCLELTLCVAPANKAAAIEWFDMIRRNASSDDLVDLSQTAISLNSAVPSDKLRLNLLRTKKMEPRTEALP